MDKHITNESTILTAQNPYPTGYPSGFREFTGTFEKWEMLDIILDSPKLQKNFMYLNVPLPRSQHDFVVYDNKDIEIILLQIGMN